MRGAFSVRMLATSMAGRYENRMGAEQKYRLGVLGSGKGSNFVAIADACAAGTLPRRKIALVISDVADARGFWSGRVSGRCQEKFIEPGKFLTKLDEDAERAVTSGPCSKRRLTWWCWRVLCGICRPNLYGR